MTGKLPDWLKLSPLARTAAYKLAAAGVLAASMATARGEPRLENLCPPGAVPVPSGASIQAAVDRSAEGTAFCLETGVHRLQVVRPKARQSFYGENQTVLNGSRLLTVFRREGTLWIASGQRQLGRRRGECAKGSPGCNLPEGLFMDDRPLLPVLDKHSVGPGRFYLDRSAGEIYFADDPAGRKVEATVAAFAFESTAPNVLISNVTIEKYSSLAQKGAIDAQDAVGWIVENCEVRFNSAGGIGVGARSQVRDCNVHHNGQIGITGSGGGILIDRNHVWANNTRGFSSGWEAGGVKLAEGDGIIFRGNHVEANFGPGLWCDINCRNVLYESNVVERNQGTGILHEISFGAIIRNNVVRKNSVGDSRGWFWGNEIAIAGSQDAEVYGNTVTVAPGRCGITLIDQSRDFEGHLKGSGKYKTRNNRVHDNDIIFEGSACAGGASDAGRSDENFSIITDGNNSFDRNTYRVPRASDGHQFVWGHTSFSWSGFLRQGLERNGQMISY